MIVCHPLKLIFIKTKKVGGTSFEIALSSFCDEASIITAISPADEATRSSLGYPGPQNLEQQDWPSGTRTAEKFYNHIPAVEAKARIPADIWESYTKVTIWRDPHDAIISRYYWEKADTAGIPFGQFVEKYSSLLTENRRIAPLEGPDAMDVYLRYEHLEEDIAKLGIDSLWERFSNLRAKGNLRPRTGADPATLFAKNPKAADIVAEQCGAEIRKFGYSRPGSAPAAAQPDTPRKSDFIFTLSAGRTGTAWLAKFLAANLKTTSVHEPLDIGDFGNAMPEISHMRRFNTMGMDGVMLDFWQGKLASLQAPYAESNHTLGKCGLIEALSESSIRDRSTVIILRRDLARQCASYVTRNDFENITVSWQWYLEMNYPNIIVNPAPFSRMGQIGRALWYTLEMEARYAYYKQKYGHLIHFAEIRLEKAATADGAAKLMEALGQKGRLVLPAKTNAGTAPSETTKALAAEIRTLLARLDFDPDATAARYIKANRSLSSTARRSAAA